MFVVNPHEENITLVGYLEKMPDPLMKIIKEINIKIEGFLKEHNLHIDKYEPYKAECLHGTLLGMEAIKIGINIFNTNFMNNCGLWRTIDPHSFLSLLDCIVSSRTPLFTFRFGGYTHAHCKCKGFELYEWECTSSPQAEFHAFKRTAYEGSFYAYPEGPVMITGWGLQKKSINTFPRELYGLRVAAEECGLLDKYHTKEKPYWRDDDFYIKIGEFKGSPQPELKRFIEKIRLYLASIDPVVIDLTLEDIDFVYYQKSSPLEPIDILPLKEALADPSKLTDLYKRWEKKNYP